jgi:hypothetical protein
MKEEKVSVIIVDYLKEKVYFTKIPKSEVWDLETKTPPAIWGKRISKVKDLAEILNKNINEFKIEVNGG